MKKFYILALAGIMTIGACAEAPENIAPAYISPAAYSGYSCQQLNAEAVRVNARLVSTAGQQQSQANNDQAMTAVALILFWPAAFFIGGGDQGAAIAQLRGEAEAISAAAVQRGC